RISDTAPGRTPMAAARPPLVFPGLDSPRSIILSSSMAASCRHRFCAYPSNSDYPKSSLTYFGITEITRTQRETSGNHCRRFEVAAPRAADPVRQLQMASGTKINTLASAHDFPKFVKGGC